MLAHSAKSSARDVVQRGVSRFIAPNIHFTSHRLRPPARKSSAANLPSDSPFLSLSDYLTEPSSWPSHTPPRAQCCLALPSRNLEGLFPTDHLVKMEVRLSASMSFSA